MARRRRLLKTLIGIIVGLFASRLFADECFWSGRSKPYQLIDDENRRAINKSLLFVGVMTAAQYLDGRARAVYDTWGREVPGKVMFFGGESAYAEHVPLVGLRGVDDEYPPQRKSFRMLKYMYDRFVDRYEWFVRADDDVYIRTDRLEELLRSVDSRKPWFIGQTGRGNTEEFGLLSLDDDENFCMGGPGVILSRETLKRIGPWLEECLDNLYTTHEDVELGRCVKKYAGISCTWSYEMQVILYHNQSGNAAFSGDLKQKEVHRAITLHPVKQPQYMYRLHKYFKGLKIQNNQQKRVLLHRDIASSMQELGYRIDRVNAARLAPDLALFDQPRGSDGYLGDSSTLGVPAGLNRYIPQTLDEVLEWELICKTLYTHRDSNPRKRIGSSLKEGLGDVVREIMELINSFSRQRGRVIDFKEILYGYWRLDPSYGVDLILDMLLVYKKYRGHKMTVQVRRHAYVQQTFTGIFVREVEDYAHHDRNLVNSDSLPVHKQIVNKIFSKINEQLQPLLNFNDINESCINFIVPLSGRHVIFTRFAELYEEICLKTSENTNLYVVLYRNAEAPEDYNKTAQFLRDLSAKHPHRIVQTITPTGQFSRGKALQHGVDQLHQDSLMLFIDVDMVFDRFSLRRIRSNAVQRRKLYFPIVYSLYNPRFINASFSERAWIDPEQRPINDINGFWRQFGFGIASLYKSDYDRLGGFDLEISDWGNEDVAFYDNAVRSELKIVRSADPGLVHIYHPVRCDGIMDVNQKAMCSGTKASTLGSLRYLQALFLKYKDLFR